MRKILLSLMMLLIALGVQAGVKCYSYDSETKTAVFDYNYTQGQWTSDADVNDIKVFKVKGSLTTDNLQSDILNNMQQSWADRTLDLSEATFTGETAITSKNIYVAKLILPNGFTLPTEESYYQQNGTWNGGKTLRYACALSADGTTINIVGGNFENRGSENAIATAIANNEYPFNVATVTNIYIVADFGTEYITYITDADKTAINNFNAASIQTSFDATTGTLTLSPSDLTAGQETANISTIVSSLDNLSNKSDIAIIEFHDGSTYEVASGKFIPNSGDTSDITTWLTTNGYTLDASFDLSAGTLTLANLNSSVSTLVSDANLSDFNNKNDVQTIVFPDGSTYDVASQKLSAASTSADTNSYTTWLTNNGYRVMTTEVKIGDFITWDSTNGILTLDYTTGKTLSSTDSNGNSYENLINNFKDSITKVVIKSENADNKKFPVNDLDKMTNWPEGKIMDFTQAEGIDGDLTSKGMRCKAIYLPSTFTFPATTVYAGLGNNWNQSSGLEYVCQLNNGELTIGAATYNTSESHPADAVKRALDNNPLEYPFSEATRITLVGNPTQNDQNAVAAFNATTYDAGTHTLTLSASDLAAGMETANIGSIVSSLSISAISDIQVIKFPDGSTYNVASKTLTAAENSTNINDNIQWLIKNGYSDIVKTEIGKYVSVVDGKTILTIPDNEPEGDKDVVTSNIENSTKLSTAEKNALKSATNLVVVGEVTENDWGGLQHIAATTLDLTGAKIGNTFALANALRENVQNLTLPNDANYTSVPADFAYNALALQSVTLPSQITEIGDRAFFGCGNLASVDLPANLTTIGESAFQDSGLKTLVLPGKLTTVRKDAFFDCGQLENVEMKQLEGSCTFGDRAFGSCFQLKHITLSEGVDAISTQMFDKCGMLESIRIPSSCKTIGQEAFNICASLHSIVIPEGVDLIEKQAFTNSGITDIYVMATEASKVPKIYCMTGLGSNSGTFSSGMVTSDSWDPYDTHKNDITTASDETILSWYQDDRSNGQIGLGGGSCMVRLHYPEDMRSFYDGYANPLYPGVEWVAADGSIITDDQLATDKKDAMVSGGYISSAYAVGSEQYPAFGPQNVTEGTTTHQVYWPRRTDYALRLRAGDPQYYGVGDDFDNTKPTTMAWRQLPLHQVSKPDDFVFTKQYDDTWYTMCFPWDMEDNTLFSTFNQKLEIVEFVGVEVEEETTANTKQLNLIFHFDKVAGTYYMTENHRTDGLEYERVEGHIEDGKNTTRVETITLPGGSIQKRFYTYHRIKGDVAPEYVYWPFNLPEDKNAYTPEQKAMVDRYESIRHYMVFAGHPYMIHPAVGATPGNPTNCTIAGVKKLVGDKAYYTQLATDSAVTKATTTDGTFQHPGVTLYDGGASHYTFIGNIFDAEDQDDTTTKRSKMTDADHPHAYFLAVDPANSYYPKYYRKSYGKENSPSWSQYSAIIRPDATALSNIEAYMNLTTNGGSSSAAKPFDIEFGKWEVVDVTAIEEIISEAERNNQPVERVHLNVVFNIKGQVIREGSASVDGLPEGLYIVNGKKYMVK